jgi:hypothetical protein
MIRVMENDAFKRYERVILVGQVTEVLIDRLRQQARRERILRAFGDAEGVSTARQGVKAVTGEGTANGETK